MATQTGELRVRVSAEDKASGILENVKRNVIALAGAWAGMQGIRMAKEAVQDTVQTFIQYTNEIDKANKVTGIATDTLQEMAYAAEQEHASFEALQKGLVNLTVRLGYAGDGLATYTRYFKALGIEYRNANGTLRDTYDVFLDIADVASKGKLSTEELAAVMQLLGARSAKELIPMLKKGSEWFRTMADEANNLHIVLDDRTIKSGKRLSDQLVEIQKAIMGVRLALGDELLPILEEALPLVKDYVLWGGKLLKVYGGLIDRISELYWSMKSEEEQQLHLIDLWRKDVEEKRKAIEATDDLSDSTGKLEEEVRTLAEWFDYLYPAVKYTREELDKLIADINLIVPPLKDWRDKTEDVDEETEGLSKNLQEVLDLLPGIKDVSGDLSKGMSKDFANIIAEMQRFGAQFIANVIDNLIFAQGEAMTLRDILLDLFRQAFRTLMQFGMGQMLPGIPLGAPAGGGISPPAAAMGGPITNNMSFNITVPQGTTQSQVAAILTEVQRRLPDMQRYNNYRRR